ncbi:hypothetical protein NLM24_10170 [Nocardia zapadnayensis]|uniref:hypothetical protein n=1 Tax=Nocardia rhamnosiphila TaxID=426716 RepID=UPI002248511C|nr:hypothetical protein [Nocardia zapadnayensis]MCX0271064.1 hypothetical protein [Nocardia zapadnayensis]
MAPSDEFVYDVAKGDLGASRILRRSLEVLRSSSTDPQLRKQFDDLIEGRASVREFAKSSAFASLLDGLAKDIFAQENSTSDEEKQRLAALGEAELERARTTRPDGLFGEAAAPPASPAVPEVAERVVDNPPPVPPLPGARRPRREEVVTPYEPDEDDLYFRERNERGWLV